ncbi:MAG: response regulator [Polyangiaceae bacterium]|nr:response regulator [Polyangiaceae bacterium]
MTASSRELFELFLALAPPRLAAARLGLDLELGERGPALVAALVPLAVDATLLGAEGVAALARAAAAGADAPRGLVEAALATLETACEALGHGDASGARVDESALLAQAEVLRARHAPGAPRPPPPDGAAVDPRPRPPSVPLAKDATAPARATDTDRSLEEAGESAWEPTLADDMIAAFLDECGERLDGLGERLLELEERSSDRELVSAVFRDLHTLKGSSAFAGLKKMNRVAHLAEDLIGELRDGKRQADRRLIDLLLETLDVLRTILDCARARRPIDVDVSDLVRRLRDPNLAPAAPPSSTRQSPPPVGSAEPARQTSAPPPAGSATATQATLRIDFAKVDLLMNLVGEAVLSRGRLAAAVEAQGGLLREVVQTRHRLHAAVVAAGSAEADRRSPTSIALEDLQRIERVLHESYDDLDSGLGGLTLAVSQLRDQVMKLRMVPIARLFTKYQRTVRELSNKLGKEVKVELAGAETELDKVLVERLEDPLLHLVRNAVDHGIELPEERAMAQKPRTGTVRLTAAQRGGQILVTIEDDGAGLDAAKLAAKAVEKGLLRPDEAAALAEPEAFALIFRPGFSTATQISDVSGRGVGMDVVRDAVGKLKGAIHVDSRVGRGTRLELRLPLTLAITQVLAARVGSELVALPLDSVVSAQQAPGSFEVIGEGAFLRLGDELVPVLDLAALLGLDRDADIGDLTDSSVVIVEVGTDRLGLLVRQVLGRHDVVIKSLGPLLSAAPCAAGATVIGDRVLLVVDLADIATRARQPAAAAGLAARARPKATARARVLIAEDSDVIRETIRRELTEAGFEVRATRDGTEALAIARRELFDAVSTDVMMPGMDGYDLTRALRTDPRYAHVPIVMVTSKDARIDALRGYDAGADAYLTKPSDAGVLIRTIDGLLAKLRTPGT